MGRKMKRLSKDWIHMKRQQFRIFFFDHEILDGEVGALDYEETASKTPINVLRIEIFKNQVFIQNIYSLIKWL